MTRLLPLTLTLALCSCALLSKGEVGTRRYFTPERPAATPGPAVAASSLELRLGRVTAGACGSEAIMTRESPTEVAFHPENRWTERPEVYVRRALGRALFEARGLRSVARGAAPVLEVELLEFEAVRGPSPVARLRLAWVLGDERVAWVQQTRTFERPLAGGKAGDDGEALARALGEALHEAVEAVASQVSAELERRPAPATN